MSVLKLKNKTGFTIIEVVLVLAIAGLIFLMVFLGLPALQRKQRDTARKQDVAIFRAAIASYRSNNRGDLRGVRNSIGRGVFRINEGPLAGYLDGISGETEFYWISSIDTVTGVSIGREYDTKTIVPLLNGECINEHMARRSVGKVAIMASLEDGARSSTPSLGRFNYCIDL